MLQLMLKLKLQYFGHLMQRTDLFEKTLMLGKIEGRRRRGQQRMRWLDGITNSVEWVWVNSRSCWWTGRPGVLQSMGSQRVGHDWVTEQEQQISIQMGEGRTCVPCVRVTSTSGPHILLSSQLSWACTGDVTCPTYPRCHQKLSDPGAPRSTKTKQEKLLGMLLLDLDSSLDLVGLSPGDLCHPEWTQQKVKPISYRIWT